MKNANNAIVPATFTVGSGGTPRAIGEVPGPGGEPTGSYLPFCRNVLLLQRSQPD